MVCVCVGGRWRGDVTLAGCLLAHLFGKSLIYGSTGRCWLLTKDSDQIVGRGAVLRKHVTRAAKFDQY